MSWMISPLRFADGFNAVVSNRAGHIQDKWYKPAEYTHLFLNKSDGVLNDVRKRLGLLHWGAEFLRLDAAYSTDRAEGEEYRLALVVEHENAVGTARWEVMKLAHIACLLRVLITYPKGVSQGEQLLTEYCHLIEAMGMFASGQLFGREDKPARDTPNGRRATSIAWRYYLFAGSKFLPVSPRMFDI
jgi:hypothetical protein